jgi:hypothetical protein
MIIEFGGRDLATLRTFGEESKRIFHTDFFETLNNHATLPGIIENLQLAIFGLASLAVCPAPMPIG